MKFKGFLPIVLVFALISSGCGTNNPERDSADNLEGKLPAPQLKGKVSVEETLNARTSVRRYINKPIAIDHVSQLLWAAQGITHSWGERSFRTAPSAGATYPLETYLFTESGVYQYSPEEHSLKRIFSEDLRNQLSAASLGQTVVSDAPLVFVFTMIEERTSHRYGERSFRYISMEAGHVAQNLHLQAVALGLGSVPVGAFNDLDVAEIIQCKDNEHPLYMVPVGYEAVD